MVSDPFNFPMNCYLFLRKGSVNMKNVRTYKYYILIIVIVIGLINPILHAKLSHDKEKSAHVLHGLGNMPKKVAEIFKWPTEDIINKNRVLANKNNGAIGAHRKSVQWIQKIVSKDWLPVAPNYLKNNLILVKDEYGLIDATHVQWEKKGYVIEVTQTQTVFVTKLVPLGTVAVAKTSAAKKQMVGSKLLDLLADEVDFRVRKPKGPRKEKKEIKSILIKSCLDEAQIYDANDITYGRCKIPDFKDKEDIIRFAHWWGRVNWWTDGKVIGVYTLKIENGAWKASYVPGVDYSWFNDEIEIKEKEKIRRSAPRRSPFAPRKGNPNKPDAK